MAKNLSNWYFGNFCTKCALIDAEETNYGKDHWEKLHELERKLGDISHKEFIKIVRMSAFCKPIPRKFKKCKICELNKWH